MPLLMRDRIAAFSFGSHSIDVASELSEDPHHDTSSWPACNYAKPRWRSCSTGDAAISILITLSPSRSPISSIESANAYRFQWVLLLDFVFTALDDSTGFRTAPPQGFHGTSPGQNHGYGICTARFQTACNLRISAGSGGRC